MERDEILALIYRIADEYGLPRLLLLGCAIAESNLNPRARRPTSAQQDAAFWPDVSGGLMQQTVRYDPAYRGGSTFPGVAETERVIALQLDPERSLRVGAENLKDKWRLEGSVQDDEAFLRTMYRYNWPGGLGQPYTADHQANYERGLREAREILGEAPRVVFNPQEPPHPQEEDFDCSQESLEWALYSLGRRPQENWLEPTMIAEGVMSRDLGLLDASGAGLAAFVRRHYGEYGYTAENVASVSYEDVVREAGLYPLLIGGRAWNHWSGVRGYDAGQGLLLANPAPGWKGIGQTLTRQQFTALGPFSMVRVLHPDLDTAPPEPTPPAPDPRDAEIAHLKRLLEKANSNLGVATVDYVRGLRDLADALEALKP
jgi:hypothetical protein